MPAVGFCFIFWLKKSMIELKGLMENFFEQEKLGK